MAEESTADLVWNAYLDKYNTEPSNAQQLLNFSKNKSNNVTNLSFAISRKTLNRNKGKGTINIIKSSKSNTSPSTPSSQHIDHPSSPIRHETVNTEFEHDTIALSTYETKIDLDKVTEEDIDTLLNEIDENEVYHI